MRGFAKLTQRSREVAREPIGDEAADERDQQDAEGDDARAAEESLHRASPFASRHRTRAAFDAEGLVLDASDQSPRWDRAILLLDDLEHSWMFRSSDEGDTIQYRSMSCRFDPSAEVPFEVYGAAGTLVQRGQ